MVGLSKLTSSLPHPSPPHSFSSPTPTLFTLSPPHILRTEGLRFQENHKWIPIEMKNILERKNNNQDSSLSEISWRNFHGLLVNAIYSLLKLLLLGTISKICITFLPQMFPGIMVVSHTYSGTNVGRSMNLYLLRSPASLRSSRIPSMISRR